MSFNEKALKAVYTNNLDILEKVIGSSKIVNEIDLDGRTLLVHAILGAEVKLETIQFLLESGADVNIKDNGQKWAALAFAARDRNKEVVQILVEYGAIIDAQDVFGNTALWRAVMAGKSDNVLYLLLKGADPSIENISGVSPKKLAVTLGVSYFN